MTTGSSPTKYNSRASCGCASTAVLISNSQLLAIRAELVVIGELNGDRRPDYVVDELPELILLTAIDCDR